MHATREPSPWVVRHAPLIAAHGRVLDLAAGHGRHARFLAGRGHAILAIDRDAGALAGLAGVQGVTTVVADLESTDWPLTGERFDAIVIVNYLHRARHADLLAALAPDGVLIHETFAAGNERYGKPSNPAFLLSPGELLQGAYAALTVVAFEQGVVDAAGGAAVMQRLAAVGRGRPWPPALAQR